MPPPRRNDARRPEPRRGGHGSEKQPRDAGAYIGRLPEREAGPAGPSRAKRSSRCNYRGWSPNTFGLAISWRISISPWMLWKEMDN